MYVPGKVDGAGVGAHVCIIVCSVVSDFSLCKFKLYLVCVAVQSLMQFL